MLKVGQVTLGGDGTKILANATAKNIIEPVFGIIKAAMGFWHFSLKDLGKSNLGEPEMNPGNPELQPQVHENRLLYPSKHLKNGMIQSKKPAAKARQGRHASLAGWLK